MRLFRLFEEKLKKDQEALTRDVAKVIIEAVDEGTEYSPPGLKVYVESALGIRIECRGPYGDPWRLRVGETLTIQAKDGIEVIPA